MSGLIVEKEKTQPCFQQREVTTVEMVYYIPVFFPCLFFFFSLQS
jgi:hypothetical protein